MQRLFGAAGTPVPDAPRRAALSRRSLALAPLLALLPLGPFAAGPARAVEATTLHVLRVETGDQLQKDYYARIIKDYEAAHPGQTVEISYIANEAYKAKLPTLLQSDARPDIFYSWGGHALIEQAEAGFVKDISAELDPGLLASIPPSAVEAFGDKGQVYGLPLYATEVVIWVNTALTAKAGVDPQAIHDWDDLLAAVKTLRGAGITPFVVGGQDKWPLHFFWSYLLLREGGSGALPAAMAGEGEGFKAAPFVQAGARFQELMALDPFQKGFMGTTYETASGMFGDGEAAFELMGDWDYLPMKARSRSGQGLPDDQMALINFPALPGGAGDAKATLGGINGWAVSSSAPPQAVEFLQFMMQKPYQEEAGKLGIFIPIVKGSDGEIGNPFARKVAQDLGQTPYHQIFLDQFLGASVGATVNDISADLAAGATTPEAAAAEVQDAWDFQ